MTKKIALIDGYGFVFRAYHSLPPLTRPDGTPVGAVYGFTNMLIKLLAGLEVSHVAVVFDSGSKTFRNEIYSEYKANRPPCPEDLKPQFPIVRQSAEALNLCILEKIGFEADDIIATIAKQSAAQGHEVLIVSSDKDLMQLVGERIFMYDAMKNRMIGENEVKEKFAVTPDKVLDVLSLMGDSSDNVPGVRGIGPKTAAELIDQFGNLENIFANLDQIKQEKRRQLLADGVEKAKLSKELIRLKEDVELGVKLDDLELKSIDPHKFLTFLQAQGFHSLVTRVKKEFNVGDDWTPQQVRVDTLENNAKDIVTPHLLRGPEGKKILFTEVKKTELTTIDSLYKQAVKNGLVTIDLTDDLLTISTNKIDEAPQEIFYFTVKKSTPVDLFSQEPQGLEISFIEKILLDDSIKKIFFDAKTFLKKAKVNSFEDLLLINHLANSSIKNDLTDLINLNLEESEFPQEKIENSCFKNFSIQKLYQLFAPKIQALKLNEAYHSYEKPLLEVLAQVESDGIKVDVEKLRSLSSQFGKRIEELSAEIYAQAGCEFNIASPKQLSEVLFTKLGLNSGKKSKKTGALSTGVGVLEELEEEGHPIARKILEFRKFSKLKNTYTDALPKEINEKTGRVHTHFSTTSTITGRLSSSAPNLQNIPIKSLEGQKIREAFIAEKGHLLISADYSQIELRVIAHVAKIENLINAFKAGKDIHRITASQMFKLPEDQVDDKLRYRAKAINFGIIYGISAFGLARQLDISRQEAGDYIKSYLEAYPGIEAYMKKYIDLAHQNGFVETLSGRKCFIREINNKNPMIRAECERLAINAPIQGSAADIIKKAMIRLNKKLSDEKMKSKIILQIHDELIVEAPMDEVKKAEEILRNEMENAVIFDVPLKVDITVAESWS